jgi:hypothetical protein
MCEEREVRTRKTPTFHYLNHEREIFPINCNTPAFKQVLYTACIVRA